MIYATLWCKSIHGAVHDREWGYCGPTGMPTRPELPLSPILDLIISITRRHHPPSCSSCPNSSFIRDRNFTMLLSSSNQSEPVHLTALPAEVLHHILQWLNPADLAALPLVCHMLHAFVNSNQALCREIYLNSLVGFFLFKSSK